MRYEVKNGNSTKVGMYTTYTYTKIAAGSLPGWAVPTITVLHGACSRNTVSANARIIMMLM